ncbi:hypothetical protein NUW54_g12029 [Trametes sanguinea]|uniref:Uncharacterized protein n=1 Tax=Trametes sanguinea TaxID=158606 RepID=A0ACC1N2X8_9APHY|nr:hypothetical protein NUW54_g12029 [Trametes sanguinea]
MPKKRTRASRVVRVVGPVEEHDDYADGPPSKTFRATVMRTEAIARDKSQASQVYETHMKGLDVDAVRAIAAMRGEEPLPADQLDDADQNDFKTGYMDGVDDQDEWEDVDDGVEVDDEVMRELLVFSRTEKRKIAGLGDNV